MAMLNNQMVNGIDLFFFTFPTQQKEQQKLLESGG